MKYKIVNLEEVSYNQWTAITKNRRKMQIVYKESKLYCDFVNGEHICCILIDKTFSTYIEIDELIQYMQDIFVFELENIKEFIKE